MIAVRPPLRIILSFAVFCLLLWLDILPIPFISDQVKAEIVPVLPWWGLMSFGSFCLWTLGWGIATFGDCPEAYDELMVEIKLAKDELRSKGVRVD